MNGASTSVSLPKFSSDLFRLGPQCSVCGLCNFSNVKCLGGRGSHEARFAFVSDSPSWRDAVAGSVWSDKKMNQILYESGISLSDCYFTSLLKCSVPQGQEATSQQVSMCLPYILTELQAIKPKVIFVSGRQAFRTLTKIDSKESMGKLRGMVHKVQMPWGEVGVIATWSPAYAAHKDAAAQDIIADIMTGIAFLAPPRKTNYEWVNDPGRLIEVVDKIVHLHETNQLQYGFVATDTESTNIITEDVGPTPYVPRHNIASIQIAWNPGEAFAVPVIRKDSVFNNDFNIVVLRNQMHRILSRIPVVGQNYKFDEGYFNTKLGLKTEHFVFDTMLAHHFIHGGSLPNNLGFLTARILGWPSHKRDIEAELDAMPEEARSYGNLTSKTILDYGCRDADCTLHIAHILMERMKQITYEKFGVPVIYRNMYEAFNARVMFPWRAILEIEKRGALIDVEKMPEVSTDLQNRMDDAYSVVRSSPPHALWMLDHTIPNPKRRTYVKKASHYYECEKCKNSEGLSYEGKRPKTWKCSRCGADAKIRWKMVNTDVFTLNEHEPETITQEINLRSSPQLSEFFYSDRYLGFPEHDEIGTSTDKKARAYYLDRAEKAGQEMHAKVLIAIGEYNKASKLFTAYAKKLPNYLFVKTPAEMCSAECTSKFELDTGVNHIHTNYYQDGTVSGRLCFSSETKILTNYGELSVEDMLSDVYRRYHAYTHKGSWKPITDIYYKGREQMFTFRFANGGHITCTAGHRIWTGSEWKSARSIAESQGLACPIGFWQGSSVGLTATTDCREANMENLRLPEASMVRLDQVLVGDGPQKRDFGSDREDSHAEGISRENGKYACPIQETNKESNPTGRSVQARCSGREYQCHGSDVRDSRLCCEEFASTSRDTATGERSAEVCGSQSGCNGATREVASRSTEGLCDDLLHRSEGPAIQALRRSSGSSGDVAVGGDTWKRDGSYEEAAPEQCILLPEHLRSNLLASPGSSINSVREVRSDSQLLGGLSGSRQSLRRDRWKLPSNRSDEDSRCAEGITPYIASGSTEYGRSDTQLAGMYPSGSPVSLVSVESVGEQDVWDISVDDHNSFLAQGLYHHNSTRDPSLHTIPRKSSIKKLFISRFGSDGLVLQNDLSQAEVRAFVIETGDESLREAFIAGVDPYIKMAANTYSVPLDKVTDDMRQDNKSIVLGLLFGRGATAISEQIKKDVAIVKAIIGSFFGGMPKLKAWIDYQHRFAERFKCVVSRFGRIRPLVDQIDADDNEMLNHAHNVSVNHPIQGMVGDLCIDSVARIEYAMRRRGLKSVIFNTVHDSTIVDLWIPELVEVMTLIREEMFTKLPDYFPWIDVPFAIDQELGLSWGKSAKASVKDRVLSISGDPATVNDVMGRVGKHFKISVVGIEPKTGKDGSVSLTFKGALA